MMLKSRTVIQYCNIFGVVYLQIPFILFFGIWVKTLIFCHPEDEMPIKYMAIRSIPRYKNFFHISQYLMLKLKLTA